MVYGLCRILLQDAVEAEDAAQQVFLSAHQSILGGTEPREPAAWLGKITRNECRARIRARMATPLALVDERPAVGADVEQAASRRAEIEALCAALAELPDQQRQAVLLREFYGLSYEEMSAALGLTEGAVESLLFRARRRLQEELRPVRVASGTLLPATLGDSLAGLIPGFGAGSSAGILAKLASLPVAAKLTAAAASVTAASAIGLVELRAPEREDSVPHRPVAASRHLQPETKPMIAQLAAEDSAGSESASHEPPGNLVNGSESNDEAESRGAGENEVEDQLNEDAAGDEGEDVEDDTDLGDANDGNEALGEDGEDSVELGESEPNESEDSDD
jgi:RNA polymerase sigma factor (sigma-70 family)